MGVNNPPWSDLPQELLSAIATNLRSNPVDMLSFRNVCKSWRSSSSLPPPNLFHPLPLTVPSPPYIISYNNSCKPRSFSSCLLSVTVVYALRSRMPHHSCSSSRGFLLFTDQSTPAKLSLRKPFDNRKYDLPVTFPQKIDVLSFHASELGRFYNLALPKGWNKESMEDCEISHWSGVVHKVVLFLSIVNDGGGLFVLVLYEEGQLGLLRLLVNDDQKNENVGALTKWEIIHYGKRFRFDDIVDFKGRVLGVDRRGRVYNIDLGSSPTMINVIVPAIIGGGGRRKRLVESLGRLHLVVRTNARDRTNALFKVYQLCEDSKNWVEVSSLGDQTFFVGLDFSISASADQLHGSCGKNWILYKERSFLNYYGKDDDDELFRSLEYDQLRIGVWRLEDAAHLSGIGSYPDYANVFWPPPTWFSQSTHVDESKSFDSIVTELDLFRKKIHDDKSTVRFKELPKYHKKGAIELVMRSHTIKELLNRVKHIYRKLDEIEMIAVPLQQHCNSKNLHNQVRTSTLETEDQCLSTDSLHRAITQFLDSLQRSIQRFNNSDFDWYKLEWNVNKCILQFEKTVMFFEIALMI